MVEVSTSILNVKKETLDSFGAVSEECALEMAEGVFTLSEADIAISVTGVAGPDTDEGKAVGTVYVGVKSQKTHKSFSLNLARGNKERDYIRELAVNEMLNLARLEANKLTDK